MMLLCFYELVYDFGESNLLLFSSLKMLTKTDSIIPTSTASSLHVVIFFDVVKVEHYSKKFYLCYTNLECSKKTYVGSFCRTNSSCKR